MGVVYEKEEATRYLLGMVASLAEHKPNSFALSFAIMDLRNFVKDQFNSKEIFLLKIRYPHLQEYL